MFVPYHVAEFSIFTAYICYECQNRTEGEYKHTRDGEGGGGVGAEGTLASYFFRKK